MFVVYFAHSYCSDLGDGFFLVANGNHCVTLSWLTQTLVFLDMEKCGDGPDDDIWRKYLGDGAKTKVRALGDILKSLTAVCDAQTNVDEFNVLLKDKKQLHAIHAVLAAWYRTGGGLADSFNATFDEEIMFYIVGD